MTLSFSKFPINRQFFRSIDIARGRVAKVLASHCRENAREDFLCQLAGLAHSHLAGVCPIAIQRLLDDLLTQIRRDDQRLQLEFRSSAGRFGRTSPVLRPIRLSLRLEVAGLVQVR